jgi:iron complex transport system substrate-binding protein
MRKHLLLPSLLITSLLLAGCAASPAASSSGDDASSGWSYESGNGETVELDVRPTRIIAHAYAAKVLMSFGITPVGIYADGPISEDVGLEGADFSGVAVLGEEWGKIDVEQAATLAPDLIVGDWWPTEDAYSGFEGGVEEASKKLADLAPVVGPSQGDSIVDMIEGYATLAASLGADTATIEAQRDEFEDAVADFEAATAAKPDLTVLAISPWDGNYAIAVPEHAPELLDLQRWGLQVIDPETPDPDFPYWQTLSMEEADTYQPDLLLFDDRNYPGNRDELAAAPTADSIAAWEAGAVSTWPAYWLHTYPDFTAQLERLTTVVEGADEDLGSS